MNRGRIIWTPDDNAWERSNMRAFSDHVAAAGGPRCENYAQLLEWSLTSPSDFWCEIASWQCVDWRDEPIAALATSTMPGATWFPGGTLNYAQRALAHANVIGDEIAVIARSQSRDRIELTWRELVDQVARCRAGLVRHGVGIGDRVVAFTPNTPETLVAFLATASLGAIWSTCAPEFGVRAVTDRWQQIEPKVMFAVDGYLYGERPIQRAEHVAEIAAALPTLEHIVHLPYLDVDAPAPSGGGSWNDLLVEHEPLAFTPVPFDHPLYVLFSSGTTGLPKPIVHGHGGITLEHLKTLSLHYDLVPGDRLFWFTTTGWMMWNFIVSGLLTGSTVVMFDGDPAAPDLMELWRIAAEEHVDVLGFSAPFLMACRKAGLRPGEQVDLGAVRHLGSTGAPLPSEGFEWVMDAVGQQVQIGSMSGGTDVCTGFVGTCPTLPIRAGEIGTVMLGCDVRAFTPVGDRCAPGETGELVITAPMPSMPVGLWGDDSGERLTSTYFATFPGVWHHGDWITFHDDGACEISGRSDATLNRGGVRLGTSDFYVVVESMPEIVDSLVVHLEDTGDDAGGPGELILLVALTEGAVLTDELRTSIGRALRTELSPRHVPDSIDQVAMIPRTLSGKKLEVPIKRMLLGMDPEQAASRDSLSDPAALDAVIDWMATRP